MCCFRKKPSSSAYGAAITYHYYKVAIKEYTAVCFFVTIASDFGIMRLIPNSPKTRERTPVFLLGLDQAFVRFRSRKMSK